MFSSQSSQVSNAANYIEDVFSTYLYTGNSAARSISNGINLSTKGGMVWIKSRPSTTDPHVITDTARGATKYISSNATTAETTNAQMLTAFNADGFSLGTDGSVNQGSTTNYASWTFRKQAKFFDVVTYTGDGVAGKTIAHNLGSTPGCIIVKSTSTTGGWAVYHRGLNSGTNPQNYTITLNSTAAQASSSTTWNNTAPTSTNFTVGTASSVNTNGTTYVAYIFAHDAGGFGLAGTDNVISCGFFSGSTITLGYEPQWLMFKRADNTGNWRVVDNMRGWPASGNPLELYPNLTNAETSNGGVNPTATGFESVIGIGTYIYVAIRGGHTKVPTDATKVYYNVARTGTGATATITNNFVPDLVIGSARGVANGSGFSDFLRGPTKILFPYGTYAQSTLGDTVTARTNTTYTVGADASTGNFNTSGATVVHNVFQRAPSFFDEVCYVGDGSNRTLNHNLGAVPEMIICKKRDEVGDYPVYHAAMGATKFARLNTTGGFQVGSTYWNNTAPTASVFSLGTDGDLNNIGIGAVAYLFATCAGVSKVGSYTGNATLTTINCGFTGGARFVMIKRTDATGGNWVFWDSARGIVAGTDPSLAWNSTSAESNANSVYAITTGFQLLASPSVDVNTNGVTYIYFAIA